MQNTKYGSGPALPYGLLYNKDHREENNVATQFMEEVEQLGKIDATR